MEQLAEFVAELRANHVREYKGEVMLDNGEKLPVDLKFERGDSL